MIGSYPWWAVSWGKPFFKVKNNLYLYALPGKDPSPLPYVIPSPTLIYSCPLELALYFGMLPKTIKAKKKNGTVVSVMSLHIILFFTTVYSFLIFNFLYFPNSVGHSEMSPSYLVENCVAASYHVAERIPGKWSNIQSISVKSTNSVSLPFYTVTPKELLQLFPRKVNIKSNKNNVDQEENPKEEDEKDIMESASKNKMTMKKKKLKNSLNTHTTTIDYDDDNGNKKKTKVASKSPLLAALKKQKEQQAQLQELAGHTFESDNDNNLTIPIEGSSVRASESTKKIKGIKRKESVANTTAATATTTSSPSDAAIDSTPNKKKKKIDNIPLNMNDAEEIKQGNKKTKDNKDNIPNIKQEKKKTKVSKDNIPLNRSDGEDITKEMKKTKVSKDNIPLNRNDGDDITQENKKTKVSKDNIPLNNNDGEDIKQEKQKMKNNNVNRKADGKGLKNRKGK
jgi:hypothetical protein